MALLLPLRPTTLRLFSRSVLALLAASCAGGSARSARNEATVSGGGVAAPTALTSAPEDGAAVPISSADPTWGSRRALVSIVIFGDFQCPYTGRIVKTVEALKEKYGPTDLRVVWKEEPLGFHERAKPASEAAEVVFALGHADAFWKFWELALTHQTELSDASFEAWAQASGVDLPSFRNALAAHAMAAKVEADRTVAQRLRVDGTPTFYVNGIAVVGAEPLEAFVTLIDAELAKAKDRLAAGVAPDALYADVARANWKLPDPPPPPEEEKEDTTTVWHVGIAGAPVRGRADALVTIVEFSDFQCPYCKQAEGTLKQVRDAYGDKVRIVWRDEPLPFHKHALPAAELAREARAEKGDAAFWLAHDAIFDASPKLGDDDLVVLARPLGLDPARVTAAIQTKKYQGKIEEDLDLADELQANGTPHFFVNGRRLAGAQPFEVFKAMIDEEVRHGEALVAQGTPKRGVYDAIMKTAVGYETRAVAARRGAPSKGAASAPVVIQEFADFQCPYCTRAEATMVALSARYGARVRFVWRNLPLPFHSHALEAAEAAAEAQHQKGDAGFWGMHDKLFAHQGDADGSGLERPALDTYARELGLDVAAFDRALDGKTHQGEIDEDTRAAEAAHIDGTPAFLVGNYYVSGAQPLRKFERLVDEVLASGPGTVTPPR